MEPATTTAVQHLSGQELAYIITAMCAGISSLIASVGALIVGLRNNKAVTAVKTDTEDAKTQLKIAASAVAEKVEAVKELAATNVMATATKLENMGATLDKVHTLTNGGLSVQMEGRAVALRANANSLKTLAQVLHTIAEQTKTTEDLRKAITADMQAVTAETLASASEEQYRKQSEKNMYL